MSLYNMMNGFNPACVIILPMLGKKANEYPRFRDCFIEDGNIAIYTRVGGGNRNCGYGEEALYEDPNFITTYDDEYDTTYATYLFKVPDKWKADFEKIEAGEFTEVSDDYYKLVSEFYPTLAEKGIIKKLFRSDDVVADTDEPDKT